jgi:hypothetical protein
MLTPQDVITECFSTEPIKTAVIDWLLEADKLQIDFQDFTVDFLEELEYSDFPQYLKNDCDRWISETLDIEAMNGNDISSMVYSIIHSDKFDRLLSTSLDVSELYNTGYLDLHQDTLIKHRE